ncbi:hypothetical protein JCM8097_001934 [Rhodosporidiobolus ruineniae]
MASFGRMPPPPQPYASPSPVPAYAPAQAVPAPAPALAPPHPSHLPTGTIVNVGDCTVTVDRFLSEGGFAHVYLATSAVPLPRGSPTATTKHVLKRMVVPDKRGVEEVGREVDVMRQLKNHPKIVNMIKASVADLPGGVDGSNGYEIYILMEWCPGGGIIDMMNARLQNRLTESEILKIFSDVVEAVAHMHYQSPPLIHRDLKVENILLTPPNTFKLCDFGSTTRPLPRDKVPTAVEGIQRIELEINKTTTLQYRAPELVDVWGRKGFDEKIDIWALGVLLYKLCFYTTPFEEHGPLAILNAQYKFPPYPAYSSNIRTLISGMLQERASQRPNIYQVHEMVCRLRGAPVRLENKYALTASSTGPSLASSRSPALSPTANLISSTALPAAGSSSSLPGLALGSMADQIAPMRRGRPTKPSSSASIGQQDGNRLVKTGMAAFGAQGEESAPGSSAAEWESFGASAKSPALGGGFGSAPSHSPAATGGFGDAFAPSPAAPAKAGNEIEMEVELPRNAAMFAELVPPSSSSSASAAAANGRAGAKSPMNVLMRPQSQRQAVPAGGGGQGQGQAEEDPMQRFQAAFPDLSADPDFAAFAPAPPSASLSLSGSSSAPPAAAAAPFSLIDAPSPSPPPPPPAAKMPAQLTGDAPGPPLPRRPPTSTPSQPERLPTPGAPSPAPSPAPDPALPTQQAQRQGFKPELVSRGSQTSPHLLASWRNGSAGSAGAAKDEPPKEEEKEKSGLRQSSVPELELEAPSPAEGEKKPAKAAVDLLGDDDAEEDGFAPRSLAGQAPLVASPSSAASTLPPLVSPSPEPTTTSASSLSGNVASKHMSFASPSPSASPIATGGEREKFRPVTKRASWLPSASSSASSSPVPASPKPILPPKPAGKSKEEDEAVEAARTVEERFPALSIEDDGQEKGARKGTEEQWEKVVEKEDEGEDSSDEEVAPAPAPPAKEEEEDKLNSKPSRPDWDEDDFAPSRPVAAQQPSTRPKFGGGFKPSTPSSANAAPTLPPLSTSPAPLASPAATGTSLAAPVASSGRGLSTSSTSTSTSEGDGGIDLGPALASIRRFAPSGSSSAAAKAEKSLLDEQDEDDFEPSTRSRSAQEGEEEPLPSSPSTHSTLPPLAAPKPQSSLQSHSRKNNAAINSLASRFEGRSLTGGPPPLGVKPVGLRKDSTGSNHSLRSAASAATGGTSAHGYQRDEVRPRALPQWAASAGGARSPVPATAAVDAEKEEHQQAPSSPALPPKPVSPAPSAGFSPSTRAPFKPVPPPGSPSSSSPLPSGAGNRTSFYGARPAFNAGGGAKPSSPAPAPAAAKNGDEEQEQRFAGVSSMKSRWESMAKTRDEDDAAARRSEAAAARRKEYGVV